MEAYLDIETTGLSRQYHEITVVGIHRKGDDAARVTQLVGIETTAHSVLEALNGAKTPPPTCSRNLDKARLST